MSLQKQRSKIEKRERFVDVVLLSLKSEDKAMSQGMQVAWLPLETRKGKGIDSPLGPAEGTHPCQHFDFRTSDLQNCMIINLYCSKLLNLCYFVTTRIEN